ncbi:speckle-type POZ protein-like [Musca autumnalis]|uniref:speckle-type POZ protein-like n=1 Tax=Musca autumnalis TaxID=221902 RepID=UPI003CEDC68C
MAASIPPVKFCCLHSDPGGRWSSKSWHCDRTTVFHHSYLWKIEKFDTIKGDVYSPVIEPCNDFQIKWQITLHQSDRNTKGFLVRMLTPNRRSVGFKLTFNILKPDGQVDDSLGEVDNIKFNSRHYYGFDGFLLPITTITQLRDPSRNLLKNGSLHLKCDFSVMVDVIDFSPWEDLCAFQTDMHKPMATLLQSGKFSDVTLIVKGEKLFAHKAILYPRSSVFAAMFEHETMAEYKTNQVIINDFEPAEIEAYKGCSENNVPTYYGDFLHFV